MIDRKEIYRAQERNPISRIHADDDPTRRRGASGMDCAYQGYAVVDRFNPHETYWNPDRLGVRTAVQVHQGARREPDEYIIGHLIG